MSCPVCGAGGAREKLRKDGVPILACPACGLAWWEPGPEFRPRDVYDAGYFRGAGAQHAAGYDDYGALEGGLRRSFAARLARLGAPAAGQALLDVGAAYGFAVAEAARLGWRAVGVEVAAEAARQAGRAAPGRVAVASADALPFPNASFHAATLWDVLEHLPDPHAALAELARCVAPGGRLALTTGDVESAAARISGARWHLYNLPEHLFFYSRRSLRHLLARHGFRVSAMRAEASWYTLGYLAERVRKTVLGRPGRRPLRFPGSRVPVPFQLFDVVTVQATREGG